MKDSTTQKFTIRFMVGLINPAKIEIEETSLYAAVFMATKYIYKTYQYPASVIYAIDGYNEERVKELLTKFW